MQTSLSERKFESRPAVRAAVPLFVWLFAPSGGGKTVSALRMATGMQRVVGGDIYVVDSEADRALHYADDFKFHHVPFSPPFGARAYTAALRHCVSKGAKVIIIDSMSHMHDGPGGMLEQHAAELDRIAGDDWKKRERATFLAWQKPKQELRAFINELTQQKICLIGCFRAKEKIKITRGKDPEALGLMPIASDELIYEGTLSAIMQPASGGVPTWQPDEMGERAVIKLPQQFQGLFQKVRPFDEQHGEELARWASGGAAPAAAAPPPRDAVIELSNILESKGYGESSARLEWLSRQLDRPINASKDLKASELPALIAKARMIGQA